MEVKKGGISGCDPHQFVDSISIAGCAVHARFICGNCGAPISQSFSTGAQLQYSIESGRQIGCTACSAMARVKPL